MNFPIDGFFCNDQIVFDRPGRFGSIAKGFRLHMPPIEHASDAVLNGLEDELRVLLRDLKAGAHYQFRYSVSADYKDALLDYYSATERLSQNAISTTSRNHKFTTYWQQLEEKRLRREQLHLYVNLPATAKASSTSYQSILASSATAFEEYGRLAAQVMERIGGNVTPLGDDDHYLDFLRFFNPSRSDTPEHYDPLASIVDNCLLSDASPVSDQSCNGFRMDGHYHGILALKSPPQATVSGMITMLTGLAMLDYSITINVHPLDTGNEIRREEKAAEKLQRALRHQHSERMRSALEARQSRIRRLISNEVVPFQMQFIIRTWDTTMPGLHAKLSALKAAVVKLHGATYYAPAFPSTARNFFVASTPGWTRDPYNECTLLVEDHNLANLLPVSSASAGMLDQAEAIFPGTKGNLVGIKTFVGHDPQPQHMIISGTTGSGKSMLLSDLLLQTEPYYGFTAIVDNGMAHARYTESVSDQPPIIIRPEGNITINYLDTDRMPLSPQHLGDAAAMVAMMIGADQREAREQSGLITKALSALYQSKFLQALEHYPDVAIAAARCAMRVNQLLRANDTLTLTEAFQRLTANHPRQSGQFEEMLSGISEDEASAFAYSHKDDPALSRLLFAFLEPSQMPTHSDLVALLEQQSHSSTRNAEKLDALATQLAQWSASGQNGKLVDGVTNVDFSGSHVHIELEKVTESSEQLLSLVAFLVTNHVHNEIINRPRNVHKRVILEEWGGFRNVPGGARITCNLYQRARKYNTSVISVLQQTRALEAEPEVASSMLGNACIGLFLKQRTTAELDYLTESFALPQSTREAILRFNEPSPELGAPFVYYHKGSDPIIATARHVLLDSSGVPQKSPALRGQ